MIRTRVKMHMDFAFYCGVYGWRLRLDYDGIGVSVLRLYKYCTMLDERRPRNTLFLVVGVQDT
jgi:hypothetical protein